MQVTLAIEEDGKKFMDTWVFDLYLYNMPRREERYTLTTVARNVQSLKYPTASTSSPYLYRKETRIANRKIRVD